MNRDVIIAGILGLALLVVVGLKKSVQDTGAPSVVTSPTEISTGNTDITAGPVQGLNLDQISQAIAAIANAYPGGGGPIVPIGTAEIRGAEIPVNVVSGASGPQILLGGTVGGSTFYTGGNEAVGLLRAAQDKCYWATFSQREYCSLADILADTRLNGPEKTYIAGQLGLALGGV